MNYKHWLFSFLVLWLTQTAVYAVDNIDTATAEVTYALRVNTIPQGADVKILNIEPKFRQGMLLPPGKYDLKISKSGYPTRTLQVDIINKNVTVDVILGIVSPKDIPVFVEQYALFVNPVPQDADIKIMNITPKFYQGILLAPGDYDIQVSKSGYATRDTTVTIGNADLTIDVELPQNLQSEEVVTPEDETDNEANEEIATTDDAVVTEESTEENEAVSDSAETPAKIDVETKPDASETIEKQYALYVDTIPEDAMIKIMNIEPKFEQGILLAPGSYDLRVIKEGYEIYDETVEIVDQALTVEVELVSEEEAVTNDEDEETGETDDATATEGDEEDVVETDTDNNTDTTDETGKNDVTNDTNASDEKNDNTTAPSTTEKITAPADTNKSSEVTGTENKMTIQATEDKAVVVEEPATTMSSETPPATKEDSTPKTETVDSMSTSPKTSMDITATTSSMVEEENMDEEDEDDAEDMDDEDSDDEDADADSDEVDDDEDADDDAEDVDSDEEDGDAIEEDDESDDEGDDANEEDDVTSSASNDDNEEDKGTDTKENETDVAKSDDNKDTTHTQATQPTEVAKEVAHPETKTHITTTDTVEKTTATTKTDETVHAAEATQQATTTKSAETSNKEVQIASVEKPNVAEELKTPIAKPEILCFALEENRHTKDQMELTILHNSIIKVDNRFVEAVYDIYVKPSNLSYHYDFKGVKKGKKFDLIGILYYDGREQDVNSSMSIEGKRLTIDIESGSDGSFMSNDILKQASCNDVIS